MNMLDITKILDESEPLDERTTIAVVGTMLTSTLQALTLGEAVEKALEDTIRGMLEAAKSGSAEAFARVAARGAERILAAKHAREEFAKRELGLASASPEGEA